MSLENANFNFSSLEIKKKEIMFVIDGTHDQRIPVL